MPLYDTDSTTTAIGAAFFADQDGEPVNVVDALLAIARALDGVAAAIRGDQPGAAQ